MNRRKFFKTTLSTSAGAFIASAIGVTTTQSKATATALPTFAECIQSCNAVYVYAISECNSITFAIPREMCYLAASAAHNSCKLACRAGHEFLNLVATAEEIAAATAQWIRDHPFATAGTVVVIFGAVYVVTIVATGGTATPVLVLALAA
jgi:hypothetical protein